MMIENVLKIYRARLVGTSYYKKAALAAIEVLAENWIEKTGPSSLSALIERDLRYVVEGIQGARLEVKAILEIHRQMEADGLTFYVVEKPIVPF